MLKYIFLKTTNAKKHPLNIVNVDFTGILLLLYIFVILMACFTHTGHIGGRTGSNFLHKI